MMIHLVALVLYGSHRWCLSHVGTEGTDSFRTLGAKGRKDSRNLIVRFVTDCMASLWASPIVLRPPKCQGSSAPSTRTTKL